MPDPSPAVDLFFTDDGDGQPLLLVHGWTCDSHDWSWQLPALSAAGFRVIAADLRGHGRSPSPESGYHPRDYAADLAALLERLDPGPVVAIGHSMGGAVASILATEHPALVRGLVVVDPAYGFDEEAAADALQFHRELSGGESLQPAIERIAGGEGGDPALAAWHRRRALGMPFHVVAETVREVHGPADAFVNKPQIEQLLAARTMPVLAVHSSATAAEWDGSLAEHPGSSWTAIEGRGHWFHQEDPETFNRILIEWLASLG